MSESTTDTATEGIENAEISGNSGPESTENVVSETEVVAAAASEPEPAETISDVKDAEDAEDVVDEGEVAADYLEGLLDIADLDGDIDISVENGRPAVAVIEVNPGDLASLVGEDGAVLSALQDLTRLAVTRETGHRSRLMLDIAGHRATRRAELQRIARQAIEEAKASGEAVRMAAMTPFERKVVHDEVAAAGLTSESEGSEPRRYVVITPA